MAHDAFISYSREDKLAADAACATLEAAGIRCWIAPRDISPGAEWGEAIIEAIDHSPVMVLIFSSNANESRQIRREVERAVSQGVTIVPVRVEQVEPTRSLAYFMAGVHWLDALTPPLEQHLQRLALSIKAFLRAAPANTPSEPEETQPVPAPAAIRVPPSAATLGRVSGAAARAGRPFRRKPAAIAIVIAAAVLAVVLALTLAGVFKAPPSQQAATPPSPAGQALTQPAPAQPAPAPQPAAGQSFRDCADCPEMVVVPPGQFMMGSDASDGDSRDNERPRHAVTVKAAFAVGKYHVTRAEYAKFVHATGHSTRNDCPNFTDRDPVVCVSWDDAKAYIAWLSKTTGQGYRLLTEAEWEYAARAGKTTARYWGDAIGKGNANCDGCGSRWDNKSTSPAGSFAPNPFGLYDMLGNAYQWVEDCYHGNYAGAPGDAAAWDSGARTIRVSRGGSWNSYPWSLRAAFRYDGSPIRSTVIGFRLARTVTP